MSVEEAVTEGLQQPVDPNVQSAEDVKNMLAELKGESVPQKPPQTETPTAASDPTPAKQENSEQSQASNQDVGDKPSQPADEEDDNTSRQRDRGDTRSHRGVRGGRGRGDGFRSKSYRDNIKSDLTTAPVTDDPKQIRKQVEFYFSDSNLPMDKFLLEQVGGNKNNPVKIETLHSFKRMRRFQPISAIVAALKDSEVLEVTDDDTAVRRKVPLPESLGGNFDENAVKVFEDKAMPRSVYVKGFGEEAPSTQFDIESFFVPYGPTNAIRLRRNNEKWFKGSVFVEFATEELQKAFLALDPPPTYKGKDLKIMSKKVYCDQKVDDIKSGKIKPNGGYDRDRRNPNRSDRKFGSSKRKRDDEDDRDWRERREEDRRNGFRDDKKRGKRDWGSRGGKGGRNDRSRPLERDESGIPLEKEARDDRTDALAKAKAMVEAEQKKEEQAMLTRDVAEEVEQADQDQKGVGSGTANAVAESLQQDADQATGKKRAREHDESDTERRNKKPNVDVEGIAGKLENEEAD